MATMKLRLGNAGFGILSIVAGFLAMTGLTADLAGQVGESTAPVAVEACGSTAPMQGLGGVLFCGGTCAPQQACTAIIRGGASFCECVVVAPPPVSGQVICDLTCWKNRLLSIFSEPPSQQKEAPPPSEPATPTAVELVPFFDPSLGPPATLPIPPSADGNGATTQASEQCDANLQQALDAIDRANAIFSARGVTADDARRFCSNSIPFPSSDGI